MLVSSTFTKILMVMLMSLTFLGQAMASTVMSYHMMSMKVMNEQGASHNMSEMDHSNHLMSVDSDTEDGSDEDCCAKSCNCFTGSCSNFVSLSKYSDNDLIIDFSSKITSYAELAQSQLLSSLYRPPILS